MKLLIKIIAILIFIILMLISYIYATKNLSYNYKEPNIEKIMQKKLKTPYLDNEIKKAIEQKRFNDADSFIELSNRFNIKLQDSTKELIKKENSTTKKITRGVSNFVKGFISGKSNNSIEVAGAITSDFTIYGDLRDINSEGINYINNKPYDKMVLALSMAGLALSATQFITFGGSSTLKVAASSLKLAKKDKVITKGFSNSLSKTLDKSIDYKALKQLKYGSISQLKNSAKLIKNSVNLKPLKPLLKDFRQIQKNTSIQDSIQLLKYVDNAKDLKSVAKLSKRYKGATKGVFKVLGKNSFRLVKTGIKWSKNIIYAIVGFLFSLFGFLYTINRLLR